MSNVKITTKFFIFSFLFILTGHNQPMNCAMASSQDNAVGFDQQSLLSQALANARIKIESVEFSIKNIDKHHKDKKYLNAFIDYSRANLTTSNTDDQQAIIHLIKKNKDALQALSPEIQTKYLTINDDILIAAAKSDVTLKKLRDEYEASKEIKIVPFKDKKVEGLTLELTNGKMVVKEPRPLDFKSEVRLGDLFNLELSIKQEYSIAAICLGVFFGLIFPPIHKAYIVPYLDPHVDSIARTIASAAWRIYGGRPPALDPGGNSLHTPSEYRHLGHE